MTCIINDEILAINKQTNISYSCERQGNATEKKVYDGEIVT